MITELQYYPTGMLVWYRDKVGEACMFVRFGWLTQEQADKLMGMHIDASTPILPPKRKKS